MILSSTSAGRGATHFVLNRGTPGTPVRYRGYLIPRLLLAWQDLIQVGPQQQAAGPTSEVADVRDVVAQVLQVAVQHVERDVHPRVAWGRQESR